MFLNPRRFAINLLSITLAACGSGSGTVPADSAAKWTLTDGGECIGTPWPPVYVACTLDEHPCGGQSVCRSCNSALGLWAIMPVWSCVCASATVNGSTGLYWQCPSGPVCQLGPGTFVDSQCTEPAVIDGGIDQAAEDSGGDSSDRYSCQLNTDGTCSAITADTNCLPFTGVLYDEGGNCLTAKGTTLYCAGASASNLGGGLAPAVGCYQVVQDGGTLIYRTPYTDPGSAQSKNHDCGTSLGALVVRAPACGSSSFDSGH
jgi:hypothetical protein